jgi:mono/diheme cytochrome c family protein
MEPRASGGGKEYTLAMSPRTSRLGLTVTLVSGLLLLGPPRTAAHEIPARVAVIALVRPEGQTLRLLVRAPLEAMRDIQFPVRGGQYLDMARSGPALDDAARLWIADALELSENGRPLGSARIGATRVSLPSDRSFDTWSHALAHVQGAPLSDSTDLVWQQGMLDVLLEYPIESDRSSFSVRPLLGRLGLTTTTVLRFLPSTGGERAYQFSGDPGLIRLDPRWHQTALRFVKLGFLHILDGIDHLLFLLCLVLPFRRLRPLIAIVTSFTVAHSITLVAATLGLAPRALWFAPLIETLIAVSILYMAFENMLGARLERRWVLAFGFGLVHGFGFSFFLRDSLQFAGANLATSLLAFNLGVELGQVAVVAALVPALAWLFRRVPERIGTILVSAVVAHSAWHWMAARWSVLRSYRFEWPALDTTLLADLMRTTMLALIVAGAGWLMLVIARGLRPRSSLGGIATGPSGPRDDWKAASGPRDDWKAASGPRDDRAVSSLLLLAVGALTIPAVGWAQSAPPVTRTTRAGVYTADQALKGQELYAMHCVSCHSAVTHTGPEFSARWEGRPFWELYSFVRDEMPKSDPGSLTEREYITVLAYVLKMNGMPPGQAPLSTDSTELSRIRIEFKPARDSSLLRSR